MKVKESKICPKCGSNNRGEILYGEIIEPVGEPGEYEYGGCVIESSSPRWFCRDCGRKWGRVRV